MLDVYTREGLAIYSARSLTAEDVVQGLQRLCAHRDAPRYVKSAHGPAFSAQRVTTWRSPQPVEPHFIAPGSPGQNGQPGAYGISEMITIPVGTLCVLVKISLLQLLRGF